MRFIHHRFASVKVGAAGTLPRALVVYSKIQI